MDGAEGAIAVNAKKGSGHATPEGIPADLIQAQLERIIASSAFDASRRNCAFLRFVVEETLAGAAIASRRTRSAPACCSATPGSIHKQTPSSESGRAGSDEAWSATT
jgi:hypothetical protein